VCVTLAGEPALAQDNRTLEDRIGKQQKELDKIKKEIDEHRALSKKLRRQEKATIKKLSSLDKEIDLSRQLLKSLEQQEALITERVDSLRVQIESEESSLVVQESVLAKRLRQMYKRDPNYHWDIILGSENLQQAFRRYKFSQIIAEHDAELIAGIRERKLEFEVESAALIASLAEISVVRNSREDETEKLEKSKKQRQTTLARIRNEKTQHTEAIKELEKAQEEVKDLIGDLDKRRRDLAREGIVIEGEFAKLKGRMIRPVDGKIVRGFGKQKHPKYGTVTFNNGVDIGAAPGTPIRSVARGLVEFVDWIDGYGKCIILNHGGGYYTLYAHVSTTFVSQNQAVDGGEVIAEVGDTGSLNGYECHFEIRQSKQALNPIEWFSR
jgi:septal ring factor EnvC (AmiA/AmiB activator)